MRCQINLRLGLVGFMTLSCRYPCSGSLVAYITSGFGGVRSIVRISAIHLLRSSVNRPSCHAVLSEVYNMRQVVILGRQTHEVEACASVGSSPLSPSAVRSHRAIKKEAARRAGANDYLYQGTSPEYPISLSTCPLTAAKLIQ